MQRIGIAFLVLCGLIVTTPVHAQDEAEETRKVEPINLKLELTDKMIYNWIDLVADDMAGDYELSDDQYYQVNEILHTRVPEFLRENRGEIQRVLTEFAETFGSPTRAPDSETVAEWASRARPLLDKARESIEVMSEDFREVFDDGQIVKMDGYLAMVDAGTAMVDNRLGSWEEGSFDAETDWWKGANFEEEENWRRAEMERRTVAAQKEAIAFHLGEDFEGEQTASGAAGSREIAPPPSKRGRNAEAAKGDKSTKSNDAWKVYTEQFIVRYQLDDVRAQQARLLYNRAASDRDLYERNRLPELRRIADMAKSKRDKAAAKQAKEKFDQGVERMFDRLKGKLEKLPTRRQKALANTEQKTSRSE